MGILEREVTPAKSIPKCLLFLYQGTANGLTRNVIKTGVKKNSNRIFNCLKNEKEVMSRHIYSDA